MEESLTFDALFNTQDANLVCEIRKNSGVDDIIKGPSAVDARRNKLVLRLQTLRTHCVDKAFDFSFVRYGPVTLCAIEPCARRRPPNDTTHLDSTTMAEVEIGFVSRLKTEKPIAKDPLTVLYNVQLPICRIVERHTLRIVISNRLV